MKKNKVLFVGTEKSFTNELEVIAEDLGYQVLDTVHGVDEVKTAIYEGKPVLVVLTLGESLAPNCLEIAKEVDQLRNIHLIFITKIKDPELYEKAKVYRPMAYLVKPFDVLTIKSILEYVQLTINSKKSVKIDKNNLESNTFYVRRNNVIHRIEYSEILWLESDGNYCVISTENKKHIAKATLKLLESRLEGYNFIRVHRQYIVSADYITSVNITESLLYIGEKMIPIGRKYKQGVIARLNLV